MKRRKQTSEAHRLVRLIYHDIRCRLLVHRYTHHGGTQDAPVVDVTGLINLENRAVGMVGGFGAVHCLMQMGIKGLAERFNAFHTEAREVIEQLLVNDLEAPAIVFVFGLAVSGKSMLKTINHWNQGFGDAGGRALTCFAVFLFGALAIVGEIRLVTNERLAQVLQVRREFLCFGIFARGVFGNGFAVRLRSRVSAFRNCGFDLVIFHGSYLWVKTIRSC